jgi:hypothetical protein
LATVTDCSADSLWSFCSLTLCVERTTWPSGSKLSELVVIRSKSMSARVSTRTLPGPSVRSSISSTLRERRLS